MQLPLRVVGNSISMKSIQAITIQERQYRPSELCCMLPFVALTFRGLFIRRFRSVQDDFVEKVQNFHPYRGKSAL